MKAFIGHSFDKKNDQLVTKIMDFVKSLNIECIDAKPAKSATVEKKITELIKDSDIFVGVFSCDKPICQEEAGKWHCTPRNKSTIFTTSNWVIQESGFALGCNKHLIMLKENGVLELPELQGNLEYIPFNFDKVEDSFLKISQMVNDIRSKASGVVSENSSERISNQQGTAAEEEKEKHKEEPEDKKEEVLHKIYVALYGEKDYTKAWLIYDREATAILDEDDKVWLYALILKHSHSLGDNGAFAKLEKFAEENKDKPRVIKQLAFRYKEISEFKKAKEQFLIAAKLYNPQDTSKKSGLVECYTEAALCLAMDDVNGAIEILRNLLIDPYFADSKAIIFETMARIYKDKNDSENFVFYSEASLDNDPLNTELRFDLAYAYSDYKNEKTALLHYKKLTDTIKHSSGLNNMGASYDRLGLKGKCITSYMQAAENNETISMGNLAHLYIDAGFVSDAQSQIDKANKLSTTGIQVNPRVGAAQQKIRTLLEEEKTKQESFLIEAKKESYYRVAYSYAFYSEESGKKVDFAGEWQFPRGEAKIEQAANSFSGNFGTKVIRGSINNRAANFNYRVVSDSGSTSEISGYMVINDTSDSIEIMEKMADGKLIFEQWNRKKSIV